MQKIDEGRRGEIFLKTKNGKKIVIKKFKQDYAKGAINKEIQILNFLKLKNVNFVPKIIESFDGGFEMNFIKGIGFDKFFSKSNNFSKFYILLSILKKIYILDKLGIVHGEISNPKSNILVDDFLNVKIIDFERGNFGDFSGKNMRSFGQFLFKVNILNIEQLKSIGDINTTKGIYDFLKNKILIFYLNNFFGIKFLFLIVFIDQILKYIFYDLGYFSNNLFITKILNYGISFGIKFEYSLILLFNILALIFLIIIYKKKYVHGFIIYFLIGGTIGNLIDRILYGGVRDFIDLNFWPIFNFADIYLSIGVILIFYFYFIYGNNEKKG